jgi:hypothetical protein
MAARNRTQSSGTFSKIAAEPPIRAQIVGIINTHVGRGGFIKSSTQKVNITVGQGVVPNMGVAE